MLGETNSGNSVIFTSVLYPSRHLPAPCIRAHVTQSGGAVRAGPGAELGLPSGQGPRQQGLRAHLGPRLQPQRPVASGWSRRRPWGRRHQRLCPAVGACQQVAKGHGTSRRRGGGAQVSLGGPLTEQVSRHRVFTDTWHTHSTVRVRVKRGRPAPRTAVWSLHLRPSPTHR